MTIIRLQLILKRQIMANGHVKPADKVYRPRRIKQFRLRRALGVLGLFSAGYGDVGSSIYYALGVVALVALGATPIALAVAGVLYIFNALTYAEGTSMIPEAGGSASFARHGFNDLGGFVGGWALMLSYVITMSISAYTIPPYLSHFWPVLREPVAGTATSMGIIFFLMSVNVAGIRESSRLNIIFILVDIATQVSLIILGALLILRPNPQILVDHMFGPGNWPSLTNLIFGIAISALCFTGVETVSQLAEEAHHPVKKVPQAYVLMIFAVLALFAGISVIALSAMTPQLLGDPVNGWARDPVAGIAANLPSPLLRDIFEPLVAVLAASILLTATNAGLIGISRLAFNMSRHKQLPQTLSRVHDRFRTPYLSILLFCAVAIGVLVPGFFSSSFFADLGGLYVFGSLLGFALAHASILVLRIRQPETRRPFKLPANIKVSGRQLPLSAILGLLGTVGIWIVILVTQPFSRWFGLAWMLVGLIGYIIYRKILHIPVTYTSIRR